jgi:hypothetical protein
MIEQLKTNLRTQKILLSFLTGVMMNPIWFVIIFVIDTSTTTSNEMFSTTLLERTPIAYLFYWLRMFLPADPSSFETEGLLAVASNTILYFALSYGLLSLFPKEKINAGKILALLIGILMNPFLIGAIFMIDPGIMSKPVLFPISIFHQMPFGYMFCWSIAVLPENPLDLRAATMLPLIANPLLYFTLTYGLLRLPGRLKDRADKLR